MSEKRRREKSEVLLNTEIPAELRRRLDEYCESHGLKIKFVVAKAIEEYLDKHAKASV